MSFLNEYTVLGVLGGGSFATVYKVRHDELGYIRAIRVLKEPVTDANSRAYKNFLRECKVLLRLGNGSPRNIVHIYQPRLLDNHALVEMDYVEGEDLLHYLEDKEHFVPAEEVLCMARDMIDALAYCHEDIYKYCIDPDSDGLKRDPVDGDKWIVGEEDKRRLVNQYKVIHNDIHSGNVMRREDGSYVLLDFGLAITGDADVRHSSRHENGAPEYKSPEKWEDEETLTEQSDVYSLGIVLYEFLAGRVPFLLDVRASNKTRALFELSQAHKEQAPPSIFELRKACFEQVRPGEEYQQDYPAWLEELVYKCLEKNPEDRFRNGKELQEFFQAHFAESRSFDKEKVDALVNQVEGLEESLKESKELVDEKEQTITGLNGQLAEKEKELSDVKKELSDTKKQLARRKGNRTAVVILSIVTFLLASLFGLGLFELFRDDSALYDQLEDLIADREKEPVYGQHTISVSDQPENATPASREGSKVEVSGWVAPMQKVMKNATITFSQSAYKGQRTDGVRSGEGVFWWKDENSFYWGSWADGRMDGTGIFLLSSDRDLVNCPDCKFFVGELDDDALKGRGACYDKYGNLIYYGEFSSDRPVQEYPTPDRDKPSGKQFKCFKFSSGCMYVGETKDGKFHGMGIYLWADGDAWYGVWEAGKRKGAGVHIYSSGRVLTGTWNNNDFSE